MYYSVAGGEKKHQQKTPTTNKQKTPTVLILEASIHLSKARHINPFLDNRPLLP